MANEKKESKKPTGFRIYNHQKTLIEDLNNEEKGIILQQMFDFVNYDAEFETDDRMLMTIWREFRKTILEDREKYIKTCEQNSKNANSKKKKEAQQSEKENAENDETISNTDSKGWAYELSEQSQAIVNGG